MTILSCRICFLSILYLFLWYFFLLNLTLNSETFRIKFQEHGRYTHSVGEYVYFKDRVIGTKFTHLGLTRDPIIELNFLNDYDTYHVIDLVTGKVIFDNR